jgi:hypothetical protein
VKKTNFSIGIFFILCLTSSAVSGQIAPKKPQPDVLPPLSKPVGCGLALRYIDDALSKAASSESTIIFIIRSSNVHDISLARVRSNNLRNYVRFRGFKKYEVVVDLDSSDFERIDMFFQGELLYTLPLKRGDRLEFTNC